MVSGGRACNASVATSFVASGARACASSVATLLFASGGRDRTTSAATFSLSSVGRACMVSVATLCFASGERFIMSFLIWPTLWGSSVPTGIYAPLPSLSHLTLRDCGSERGQGIYQPQPRLPPACVLLPRQCGL